MTARRHLAGGTVRVAVLLCGALFVVPYLITLCSSFRPSAAVQASPFSPFGGGWSLDNYREVVRDQDMLRFYLNSTVVTVAIVAFQLLLAIPAAFALGHLRPRGSRVVKAVVIATLSVPAQAIAITNYLSIDHLDLIDTRRGLVLPFIASAFGVYLLCEYAESVPRSQLDAGRMLGLGVLTRLRWMVLPHMRPAIAAFAAFAFVGWWNEFFWPFIVLSSEDAQTIPFAIQHYVANPSGVPDWGPMMAAGALALLPMLLLLVLVQRSFVRAMSV